MFVLCIIYWLLKNENNDSLLYKYVNLNILKVGDGNLDHSGWERPEDMDTPRTLYKISSSSTGTKVAADYVTALTSTSVAFRDNSKCSSKLLSCSKLVSSFFSISRVF